MQPNQEENLLKTLEQLLEDKIKIITFVILFALYTFVWKIFKKIFGQQLNHNLIKEINW